MPIGLDASDPVDGLSQAGGESGNPPGKALPPTGNRARAAAPPAGRALGLARLLLNLPAMMDVRVFFDPLALGIVGGGTLLATAARGPLADTIAAFRALAVLRRRPFQVEPARAELARIERIAGVKTIHVVDPRPLRDRDVAAGVQAVTDGATAEQVEALLDRLRAERRARHLLVEEFWSAAAETAPAMGMVGTLIGLVGMFRAMDDPATIGASMAVALLATLYGALFANLVAGPIAARLRRLSLAEAQARRALVKPFRAFATRVGPRRQDLAA